MWPVLTVLDLVVFVLSGLAVLTARRRAWAWVLLVAAGLWLPLNNMVLEGPILLRVAATHGLTVSDVVGIGGAVLAGLRLWPPRRGRSASWLALRAAVVVLVVVAGFVAALAVTDDLVDRAQRKSLDIRRSASGLPPVWQVGQYWNDLS